MTEQIKKVPAANSSKKQYPYNKKKWTSNKYASGLYIYSYVYNNNMRSNIIFIPNDSANYLEVKQYFKKTAQKFSSIQLDKEKLDGMPSIQNTRIPVSLILACIKDEMTFNEICEEFNLQPKDIETAMEYVIEILDAPYQEGYE